MTSWGAQKGFILGSLSAKWHETKLLLLLPLVINIQYSLKLVIPVTLSKEIIIQSVSLNAKCCPVDFITVKNLTKSYIVLYHMTL